MQVQFDGMSWRTMAHLALIRSRRLTLDHLLLANRTLIKPAPSQEVEVDEMPSHERSGIDKVDRVVLSTPLGFRLALTTLAERFEFAHRCFDTVRDAEEPLRTISGDQKM